MNYFAITFTYSSPITPSSASDVTYAQAINRVSILVNTVFQNNPKEVREEESYKKINKHTLMFIPDSRVPITSIIYFIYVAPQ